MQAVTTYYTDVAQPLLEHYRVGLMHGRLKAAEKAAVMDAFKAGALDVLVSTTVIEVGVDVPNANIIVIENAERYGLSALHSARARGRGKGEAYCVLISDHATDAVKKRLSFLCHTNDGFEIAKFDLETRGPGDFFGSRQHGLPTLRIADLMADSPCIVCSPEGGAGARRSGPGAAQPRKRGAATSGRGAVLRRHGTELKRKSGTVWGQMRNHPKAFQWRRACIRCKRAQCRPDKRNAGGRKK